MIGQVLAALAAVVLALAGKDLYQFIRGTLHPLFSPLRLVPGPPSDGFFMGNLPAIFKADPIVLHEKWAKEYGPVIKYKVFVNVSLSLSHGLSYGPESEAHDCRDIA